MQVCNWFRSRYIDEKRVEKSSIKFYRPNASEKAVFTVDSEFDQISWQCYSGLPEYIGQVLDGYDQYFRRKLMIQVKKIV